MIAAGAVLRLERIPLCRILATRCEVRFPGTLSGYIRTFSEHPDDDPEPLHVAPHPEFAGLYTLLNGHHRYFAAHMCGRFDVVCIVEEAAE